MSLKISISGVRGTVPDSLTPDVCLNFAKAFGSYLLEERPGHSKKVVIGTDPRSSSEFIKGIVSGGLLSTGCRVIDLGICPTPTVGIMIRELKADGGIVITASHNPLPWNGLKFMRRDGIFLNESQARRLIQIYESKHFRRGVPTSVIRDPSAIDRHIQKILRVIKPGPIRRKKFRVALDACNGAGSEIGRRLLKKLGCRVEAINCDTSRPFPHPPEPVAENLRQLSRLVKSRKADIGFAFDADADRLAIVSEKGKPVGEEITLALAVKFLLKRSPKKKIVVTNLSTSRAIDDIVREKKGILIRTKVGEVHVAEELKNLKGLIGGEGNGGVIYPLIGMNRDALSALTLLLSYMAKNNKSISDLIAEIPSYYMLKKKIKCRTQEEGDKFVERVKEGFRRKDLILTEGVKVVLPSGWVHVRASNTEPIIRIIAEAKTKSGARNLIKQVLKPLR